MEVEVSMRLTANNLCSAAAAAAARASEVGGTAPPGLVEEEEPRTVCPPEWVPGFEQSEPMMVNS